jgi:predicted metal-binding transcription factor (methanogenesis marker protein 9)
MSILNKLVSDLERAIPKMDAKTQSILKQKLEKIQTKVIPVASKTVLTLQDVEDAQAITCFGLAYCCGLGKNCPWRDAARAALHINDNLYIQKEVVVWQLLAATERSAEWIEEKASQLPYYEEPALSK